MVGHIVVAKKFGYDRGQKVLVADAESSPVGLNGYFHENFAWGSEEIDAFDLRNSELHRPSGSKGLGLIAQLLLVEAFEVLFDQTLARRHTPDGPRRC